jgi:predicted GH43/DUF377 family glycosyl hydrolase
MKGPTLIFIAVFFTIGCKMKVNESSHTLPEVVSKEKMKEIYEEVKTSFKYGLVVVPSDSLEKIDCPSVFRKGKEWYMTYLVFDGHGYETWLAKSSDLLSWEKMGKIMSFSDTSDWDCNQKAGYIALQDYEWGGSYRLQKYDGKYWMSYFGGNKKGYEAGILSIGIACTGQDPSTVHEWQRFDKPVLMPTDQDVRWWENSTMYKSSVIHDRDQLTGYPFVMYYNARGDSIRPHRGAERIGMAISDDMISWKRYLENPVLDHHRGITGDAVLQKIEDIWVMFYFGAFWEGRPDAFNRFACSYDLKHWTDWDGQDLIAPGEPYDNLFAHKSSVIKHQGVVYHFYCAVNKHQDRGIAVATSVDMGHSNIHF